MLQRFTRCTGLAPAGPNARTLPGATGLIQPQSIPTPVCPPPHHSHPNSRAQSGVGPAGKRASKKRYNTAKEKGA